MSKLFWLVLAAAPVAILADQDVTGVVTKTQQVPAIAIPDLRGAGDAQQFMSAFNQTLWSDVENSGVVKMAPKTSYPLYIPQQPGDFQQPPPVPAPEKGNRRPRKDAIVSQPTGGGRWIGDWSGPPVGANYLAFGYAAIQNGVFVVYGYLFDLSRPSPAEAQVIGNRYFGSPDEAGARKAAHEFANDILANFGAKSLAGTHIYYVHQAGPKSPKEIWVMDPDGSNQRQLTHFNFLANFPAVSPDGSKLAVTAYPGEGKAPKIFMFQLNPFRRLDFLNHEASYNAQVSFLPDGKRVVYGSSAGGKYRIWIANVDGSGAHPITASDTAIELEPAVNPKTGAQVAFVSDRSGPPQIYTMTIDGGDIMRITNGLGEAHNPAWKGDGQTLAFSWTQGYEPGHLNIFVMNVATGNTTQLTHAEGKNESPSWAPDNTHIAFSSTRSGKYQIWSMLADGTQLKQLTTDGSNESPCWGQ
jgi:TolB protein